MRLTPSWAAIEGGYAGKDAARANDPTVEDASWRERFNRCPYVRAGSSFEQCEQAYCDGFDALGRHPGANSEAAGPVGSRTRVRVRSHPCLHWARTRQATRDTWNRLATPADRALPGDLDRDGN